MATTTVLKSVEEFLLGRKYFANIVEKRWSSNDGEPDTQFSNFFFRSRREAEEYGRTLEKTNRSYSYVETVSFRSREDYPLPDIPDVKG